MKRIKTKHNGNERRKTVRQITDDVIGYILPVLYISLKDEVGLSVEEIRRVKNRIDRYSSYLSQGLISFEDIKKDLRDAGYDI